MNLATNGCVVLAVDLYRRQVTAILLKLAGSSAICLMIGRRGAGRPDGSAGSECGSIAAKPS